MPFCGKCGHELANGAKFCFECGQKVEPSDAFHEPATTEAGVEQASTFTERVQEYAGKIIKCPSCGSDLPSFAAICPDCGHEINSQNVSPYVREFTRRIDEYDRAIANDPEPPKKGWKSWGKAARLAWLIFNVVTLFVPWVIYLAFPLVKPFVLRSKVPSLSTNEKQKAALIENATFPNEREATIEAMLFTKSKMAFLATAKFNKKTQYWVNLWNIKAEQLNQRAGIILKGDKIVEKAYADIVSSKSKVDKRIRRRAVIGSIIIVVYLCLSMCGYLFIGCSLNNLPVFQNVDFLSNLKLPSFEFLSNIKLPGFDFGQNTKDNFEWLSTGLSTKVPAIDSNDGHYSRNSDVELYVGVEDISYAQFESYISDCKNMGYTIDAKKDTSGYSAYNDEGYYLKLTHWGYSNKPGRLDIQLKAPLQGDPNFEWPTGELAKLIPGVDYSSGRICANSAEQLELLLYEFTKEGFDEYVQRCKDAGFTIDCKNSKSELWYVFEAYNSDGYKIHVSVDNMKELDIHLYGPKKKDPILWPTTGPAKMIPKPDKCIGEISIDFDWSFSVYITDMTIDEYNAYVDECIDAGFIKESRSEHYFSASKGKDIDLSVDYLGFNTVHISVHDYGKF